MAKKRFSEKDFLNELTAFADEQRRLIDVSCDAFPVDASARDIRITRVQKDFRFFTETYFPHYVQSNPSVFHEWVHTKLAQMIDSPKGHKVNISAPRGEAKSTLVTQLFVLWCTVTNRKRFICIIMDALDQAQSMLEAIKVELESNPRLAMDFPDAVGAGRVWNVGVILTKANIKVQAFGSGKRMRGVRHGPHRPGLVILDDLENDENIRQKAQRDKTESWVKRTVLPLGPPDGSMDVIYVNTVLHYDALPNRLKRNPLWLTVRFKSIIQFPDRLDLWQQWEEIYLNEGEELADIFYLKHQATMDKGSIVSWPSMRPLLMMMKIRAADHESFASEYQNEPGNDENAPFRNLQFWVQPCRDWVFFGAADPSLGKKFRERDPAGIVVGGLDREHGILDVVESCISRMVPDLQINMIIELQKQYNCLVWGIESVQFQEFFKDEIVKQSRKLGIPVPARGIKQSVEKELRILTMQPHVENGTFRSHQRHTVFNEQMIFWPEADHDEGPDVAHMLFMVAFSMFNKRPIPKVITGKKRL